MPQRHVVSHCSKQESITPPYYEGFSNKSGGEFPGLGYWLGTWQPCAVPHVHRRIPYRTARLPASLSSLHSMI